MTGSHDNTPAWNARRRAFVPSPPPEDPARRLTSAATLAAVTVVLVLGTLGPTAFEGRAANQAPAALEVQEEDPGKAPEVRDPEEMPGERRGVSPPVFVSTGGLTPRRTPNQSG